MQSVREFWRGGLPLGEAFWLWGVLGGMIVNLVVLLLLVVLLSAEVPAWVAAALYAAHVPVNVLLLFGVWRSAGRPEVAAETATLARTAIVVWVAVLIFV